MTTKTREAAQAPHPEQEAKPDVNLARVHDAQRHAADVMALRDIADNRDPRWRLLMRPFPADEIEKLPRNLTRNDDDKGKCQPEEPQRGKGGPWYSADGHYCGGWHARSIHLDYVGHAGITMRLNEVLGPEGWTFEPYALAQNGVPLVDRQFWGRLILHGLGDWDDADRTRRRDVVKVDLAENYSSTQEAWGDCLRRCAMRFGIGTYLWSKSDKAGALADFTEPPDLGPQAAAFWAEANSDLTSANVTAVWHKAANAGVLDTNVVHMNDEVTTLREALTALGKSLAGDGS